MKKILFALIGITLSTLFTVLLLEGALRLFPVRSYIPIAPVTIEDPVVHYQPNVEQVYSAGWDFDAYNVGKTNAQGYIADYDFVRESDKPLIAVVGDSYVEARMVPFANTMQERIRTALNDTFRVYGMGIGGSPLSQYLAFAAKMRDDYKPGFMVVNIVGNDFDESMPEYKNMPRFHYFFPVDSGGYRPLLIDQYIPSPVKEFLSNSALVRFVYFHLNLADAVNKILFLHRGGNEENTVPEDTQRLMLSKKAVDSFLDLLPRYSGLPTERLLLVIDGQRHAIYDGTVETDEAKDSYFGRMRTYMIGQARSKGYEIIDLEPAFAAQYAENGERFDYRRDGHWNDRGHAVAATEILNSTGLRRFITGR